MPKPRTSDHLLILILATAGEKIENIARIARCSDTNVSRVLGANGARRLAEGRKAGVRKLYYVKKDNRTT